MSLTNTASRIRLYINGQDYSDYLIEGQTSDDSAYSANIVTTTGTVKIGGDPSVLDYNKTRFPIGSSVNLYATLDNGRLAKLPRGHLLVLNSSIDIKERTLEFEVGCSLAFLQSRESYYKSRVEQLYGLLYSSTRDSFDVEEKDLSTLENLLDIEGSILFQDKWGWVQKVNKFGGDGIGGRVRSPKVTCFDLFTAIDVETLGGSIEELPSGVIVESSVEVPSTPDNGSNTDTEPPPFITAETSRNVKIPDAGTSPASSNFAIVKGTTGGEAGTESTARCGLPSEPDAASPPEYKFTVNIETVSIDRVSEERVSTGRYVRYDGPGNQVDYEFDFEYCSAGTWGNSYAQSIVNEFVQLANAEVQKANGLLSKVNQQMLQALEYKTGSTNGTYSAAALEIAEKYGTYNECSASQYYQAAQQIALGAENLANQAKRFADGIEDIYGYSSFSTTRNTYGKSGELTSKTVNKYINRAASKTAIAETSRVSVHWVASNTNQNGTGMYFRYVEYVDLTGATNILQGTSLLSSGGEVNPLEFSMVLASTTTTTYSYGSSYTTETETYVDHEDPFNNKKTISYSSTGSKNAPQEDRIEVETDGNGCVYLNDESNGTDTKDLTAKMGISASGTFGAVPVPAAWLGTPQRSPITVQLPMDFAPIRPKDCGGTIYRPNLTVRLNQYYRILQNYALNLAKKYLADSTGWRVTEKGTRAELFEYYPFYPMALALHSVGKYYRLRAASSNWVFDSDNVLASFDCFNVGWLQTISDPALVSPEVFKSYGKTEGTKILDAAFWGLPDTTSYITLQTVPSNGSIQVNSGGWTTKNVGDQITLADISAGNVRFVPSGTGTTVFEVSYKVTSAVGEVRSDVGIYPPNQISNPSFTNADGGDFTANTSNGGSNADAGDFDLLVGALGGANLDGGNFDTGSSILLGEPLLPPGATTSNGSADPEDDFGVDVLDSADNTIDSTTLPAPEGSVIGALEIDLDFRLVPRNYLNVETTVVVIAGWNYGHIKNPLGYDIDMETIVSPNTFSMDFGSIVTPLTPVIASGVY